MTSVFTEIEQFVKKSISTMEEGKKAVVFLLKKQEQLEKMYGDTIKLYETYDPYKRALIPVQDVYQSVLYENGMRAIEQSEEFNLPQYIEGWKRMLRNPRSLLITQDGERIKVVNNLYETGGTFHEYMTAVGQARRVVGDTSDGNAGVGREDSDWDTVMDKEDWWSWFWKEKYYSPAIENEIGPLVDPDKIAEYVQDFWSTIDARAAFFTNDAPFWHIIDVGTLAISRGRGEPHPITEPTNFVQKTINSLTDLYNTTLPKTIRYREELERTIDRIESAYKIVTSLLQELRGVVFENIEQYTENRVRERLKERFSVADTTKLERLIRDLAEGKDLPSRVSLGSSPEGNRIRPRLVEVKREIELFRRGL